MLHVFDAYRKGLSVIVLSEDADVLIVAVAKSQNFTCEGKCTVAEDWPLSMNLLKPSVEMLSKLW